MPRLIIDILLKKYYFIYNQLIFNYLSQIKFTLCLLVFTFYTVTNLLCLLIYFFLMIYRLLMNGMK